MIGKQDSFLELDLKVANLVEILFTFLLVGIQYFCEALDLDQVDPEILNEIVWFENTPKLLDTPSQSEDINHKYIYIANLLNSTNFLWYQ